ncbi:hypothetical protein [Algoriphagus sp.]|uniref:hypothetical protein n=1 Tax=Algoriphagus sp. TaxID=1872435 RepID=UPI00391D6C98
MVEEIKNIQGVKGIRVYQTSWILAGSGICLPEIGIFISKAIPEKARLSIIQHEYGHFLDFKNGVNGGPKRLFGSRILGFYILIGIPSLFNLIPLINQLPIFKGDHRTFWTEIRANQLAKAHFGKFLAEGFERSFPSKSIA